MGDVDAYYRFYRTLADKIRCDRSIPNYGNKDKDRYIGVAIGRNGQLLHSQKGHHRLALAQLLGCAEVEAKVMAVHSDWAKRHRDLGAAIADLPL